LTILALVLTALVVVGGSALFAARGVSPQNAPAGHPFASIDPPQAPHQITLWSTQRPRAQPQPTATAGGCGCVASARVAPTPTVYIPPFPLYPGGVPQIPGKVILVSLNQQWLWAYQDGQLVYNTPVTTGRPELPTPTGIYPMLWMVTGIWFTSPWPPGSPYYYTPVFVNYAMLFKDGGFFVHDAPWRHYFGPGTNVPHTNPDGTKETGSHGCVELPTPAGAWVYGWADYGTTIDIVN
jgi:hypothetical protein